MGRVSSSVLMAERVCCFGILLMGMILVFSCCDEEEGDQFSEVTTDFQNQKGFGKNDMGCDEYYVVRAGDTLHGIIDKCGDRYIVEANPHIHDPDDVFPGLLIKINNHVIG